MRTIVASLVAVIALSGCSAAEDVASSAKSQTTDEVYVETMKDRVPDFAGADDAKLIDAGKGVCEYFETQGTSLMTLGVLSQQFEAEGFDSKESATIFVVSTTAYCPEIKDDLLALSGTGF